jgi:translation initiation factor IF-3
MKQIRFGLKIGEHDLNIKMAKVSKFLDDGHKVKITLVYRGREQAHKEIGFKLAEKVINDFGDKIIIDQQPQLAGRQLNFVVRSSGAQHKSDNMAIKTKQEGDNNAQTKDS